MPSLVSFSHQPQSKGSTWRVTWQEYLLSHYPHIAGAGHVQASRVQEQLIRILSTETNTKYRITFL